MEHFVKLACVPDATATNHWRAEIRNWAADVRKSFAPSMRQKIDLDELWRDALDIAPDRLADFSIALPELPATCPLPLDAFLIRPFDIEAAFTQIVPTSPRPQPGLRRLPVEQPQQRTHRFPPRRKQLRVPFQHYRRVARRHRDQPALGFRLI